MIQATVRWILSGLHLQSAMKTLARSSRDSTGLLPDALPHRPAVNRRGFLRDVGAFSTAAKVALTIIVTFYTFLLCWMGWELCAFIYRQLAALFG